MSSALEETIRKTVAGSPLWQNAFIDGRPVRARYQMLVTIGTHRSSPGPVIMSEMLDVKPEPPGGIVSFIEWIGHTYQFPLTAINHNVSGKLKLRFVVETDGTITDVKILKDLGYGTGEEAKRVLKASPRWKPGSVNGREVRVYFELPINLSVQ